MKKVILAFGVLLALIGFKSTAVSASEFPEGTITIVCNWSPGGGQDTVSRLIAKYASERAGVPVVVNNVTGAAGAAGVRFAAEATPDGYTVGIIGSSFVSRNYSNAEATELSEIEPLAFFGPDPGALTVRSDTGMNSLSEYFNKIKSSPGDLMNGNDPPGGSSAVVASLIESTFNVNMSQVPYKGYAATKAALLSGEVQSATLPVAQVSEEHKAGSVKILGVTSTKRHFKAPGVPTFTEQGFDLVAGDWRALFVPKGVPYMRRMVLEDIFLKTMMDPEFMKAAEKAGYVVTPMNSVETLRAINNHDQNVYPILLGAGLVTQRKK
jgi:tripartite-type tricarboxylate transporter receptor subunit TctC